MKKNSNKKPEAGFTLFIAIVIAGTLLIVSTGIISLAVKESFITNAAKESQHAFYAADTGLECALYWDLRNTGGVSAFATSTTASINCNNQAFLNMGGGTGLSNFTINIPIDSSIYCAKVNVLKKGSLPKTTITSLGYNTCDPLSPRRVERNVTVTY